MLRDLTMIFSVLLAVVSVGFGVYKNVEANNAKGFAYEQAYRVMNTVQQANIAPAAKADILDSALGTLATPPPVIDLSQSSAAAPVPQACPDQQRAQCGVLASQLASVNVACTQSKGVADACSQATQLKTEILSQGCVACYTQ